MAPDGLFVRRTAIAFVTLKPVVRILLGKRDHELIAIHLRHHRSRGDRDAVAVCLLSGHNPKRVWQMFGDIVNTSIQEQDRMTNGDPLGRQRQEPPHDRYSQSIVDALGINLSRTGFSQGMVREHLANRLGNRTAPLLGDGLRVVEALGPAFNARIPDDETCNDRTSEGPSAYLVTADDAGGTLGNQLCFKLERGLYSTGREGSLDSIPTKVSG